MNFEGINFSEADGIQFTGFPTKEQPIIKVIGVGGGGGNAVNHMYNEGIQDVAYVVCNTDKKALGDSPVPVKLQLGKDGLGAGNNPEKAKTAAGESIEDIQAMLSDGTRMVFITAGMGGGTGTGAAPIIAQCAKDSGILTIGIVTIPFRWEGIPKINQALDGVEELSKHVDAMLVINNERLRTIYADLTVLNAFAKADDILSIAVRSIVDIINMRGLMVLDFQDVTTVLKDGGVAVMGIGYGEGDNRVTQAINDALNSPLLNNNDIFSSKKVLLKIDFSEKDESEQMRMEEMNEINEFMGKFRRDVVTKWGLETNSSLGNRIKITILASGFGLRNVPIMKEVLEDKDEDRLAVIDSYYGKESDGTLPKTHIFIFQPEDIDNDETISKVCAIPTYKRTREDLKGIRKKSPTLAPIAENAVVDEVSNV